MVPHIGMQELLIVLALVLLLFGAKKVPEMARGLGQGWKEFRSSAREVAADAEEDGATPVPQGLATAIESTGGLKGGAV